MERVTENRRDEVCSHLVLIVTVREVGSSNFYLLILFNFNLYIHILFYPTLLFEKFVHGFTPFS